MQNELIAAVERRKAMQQRVSELEAEIGTLRAKIPKRAVVETRAAAAFFLWAQSGGALLSRLPVPSTAGNILGSIAVTLGLVAAVGAWWLIGIGAWRLIKRRWP